MPPWIASMPKEESGAKVTKEVSRSAAASFRSSASGLRAPGPWQSVAFEAHVQPWMSRKVGQALGGLARQARWRQALQLLEHAEEQGIQVDGLGWAALVRACRGQWRKAFELLESTSSEVARTAAAQAAGRAASWRWALRCLPGDLIVRNAVLNACAQAARGGPQGWSAWVVALQIFSEAPSVDEVSFSTCARVFERLALWESCLALIDLARERSMQPAGCFNALIGAYGQVGHWERALTILELTRKSRLDTVVTQNAVGHAMVKSTAWVRALQMLQEVAGKGAVTYTTALHACEQGSFWQGALEILLEIERGTPELGDYRLAARAFGAAHHWQGAVWLQEHIRGRVSDRRGSLWSLVVWSCQVAGLPRPPPPAWVYLGCWKELDLLAYVRQHAVRGHLDATVKAVEDFARLRWLKVLGGSKARLLQSCLRPGDAVLELGCYVGYSSLVSLQQLRSLGGGGSVTTCDPDAAVLLVAEQLLRWAGASEVRLLAGTAREMHGVQPDVVVLDHQASSYVSDLQGLISHLKACRLRVVADNVLHPGAPEFLWALQQEAVRMELHELQEFHHEPVVQDWMLICEIDISKWRAPGEVPQHIRAWAKEVEHMCRYSQRPGAAPDWLGFQFELRKVLTELLAERP